MPASTVPGLLRALTVSEFRLRDQGTVLGFVWTLLHPLALFVVLRAVFGAWMGPKVRDFEGHLLSGIVLWNFFASATAYGLSSLERRRGLVLWMNLPRWTIVASAVGSVAIPFLLETALLVGVLACLGHVPGSGLLLLPAVLAAEALLALGASLLLAGIHVRVRDVERIWGLALTAGFFLTPVFYAAEPGMRWMRLNPLAPVLACGRQALLGVPASAADWAILGLVPVLVLGLGAAAFRALARDAAERL